MRTSDECLARLEALARKIATLRIGATPFIRTAHDQAVIQDAVEEANAIVAMLPAPIDPDLLEARHVTHGELMRLGASEQTIVAGDILHGVHDDAIVMHVARAALARGRELERGDNSQAAMEARGLA